MIGSWIKSKLSLLDDNAKEVLTLLILCLVSLTYFWPLVTSPTKLILNPDDGVFIAWTLDRVGDQLLSYRWASFWEAGIFSPYPLTLTFSDLYLPSVILTLPFRLISDEPIALANLNLLLSFCLTGIFTYLLLHELTSQRFISLGFTLIFLYSPFYAGVIGHLHSAAIFWVPLAALALVKIDLIAQKRWYLVWSLALIAQTATSFLPGFFIVLLTLHYWQLFISRFGIFCLCLTSLSLLPIITPYLDSSRYYHYVRPLTDLMHFSLSPDTLLTTYWAPALYLALLFNFWPKPSRPKWTLIATTALVFALGPALKWQGQSLKIPFHLPLPYALLYYLVPGLKGIRAVTRWTLLFALAATAGGAVGLSRLKSASLRASILIILVALAFSRRPKITYQTVPDRAQYPAVYSWLASQPAGTVLELPLASWGEGAATRTEIWRLLYQTLHHHPLVNGYSGFTPPAWEKLIRDPNLLIEATKPTYVLIHHPDLNKLPGLKPYRYQLTLDSVAVFIRE